MAQTAGLYYVNGSITGACKPTASEACLAASNAWSSTYGCYNGSTYRHPTACLIGTPDATTTTPAYGFSTSTDLLQCSESSCEAFAAGFNDTVPILASLFVVMIVIVGAARIARFAGEDG